MSEALDLASSSGSWGLGLVRAVQDEDATDKYGQVLQSFAAFCYQQPAAIQFRIPVH